MLTDVLHYFSSFPGRLARQAKKRSQGPILLYGAGEMGVDVFYRLDPAQVAGWVDRALAKPGAKLLDKPIYALEQVTELEFGCLVVCSQAFRDEIVETCLAAGIPKHKIVAG